MGDVWRAVRLVGLPLPRNVRLGCQESGRGEVSSCVPDGPLRMILKTTRGAALACVWLLVRQYGPVGHLVTV